jgi:MFS family permease
MLPDMTSQFAVGYGVLAGLLLRGGEKIPFRWNILDSVVVTLWLLTIISYGITESMEMARNALGDGFFGFLTPYFMARWAFFSAEGRRTAFWSVAICAVIICVLCPIEMRLRPQIWSRILDQFGLYTASNSMPLYRFGLARAQTTFLQPMDQGLCGVIMAGFIAVFAATTSIGLRNWRALAAVAAGFCVSLASLSFSAFANVAVAAGIFLTVFFIPFLGRAMILFVIAAILGGVGLSQYMLGRELGDRDERLGQTVQDSLYMRTKIMQNSWPVMQQAGWIGLGKSIDKNQLDLDSVDNAYLLMVLQRGWLYFAVFLTIPFILALKTARVWGRAPSESQRMPILIAVSVLMAILVSMYTIFFGFVYANLWLVMLGLFGSISDVLLGKSRLESEEPVEAIAPRLAPRPAVAMAGRA